MNRRVFLGAPVVESRLFGALSGMAVLAIVAAVYWPLLHAGFVWDDLLDFVYMPWLRYGDAWQHYIFRDFNDWVNYFRPLVIGMFTLQVRFFGSEAAPMHAVSLALHLIDTGLVGLLSRRICNVARQEARPRATFTTLIIMTVYGLHPALIEPVSWIGCQFELTVTLFALLALLANSSIQRRWLRASSVAFCFFLASCAKESAAVIPVVIVIYDWLTCNRKDRMTLRVRMRALAEYNLATYVACVVAGVAYLLFRHWALGALVDARTIVSQPLIDHVQEIAYVYMTYLKQIAWPMSGQGPIHPYNASQFSGLSVASFAPVLVAVIIVSLAAYGTLIRKSALAGMVAVVTIAMLPVLHIVSISFDTSLYHERYLMLALALAFPLAGLVEWNVFSNTRRYLLPLGTLALAGWLAIAVLNIRVTVPLWSDNVALWEWAERSNPSSVEAKDMLLSAYSAAGNVARARALGEVVMNEHMDCPNCLLNIAIMGTSTGDTKTATHALDLLQEVPALANSKRMFKSYLATRGRVALLEGNNDEAEPLLRAAYDADPLDPGTAFSLTVALARLGRTTEAQEMAATATALALPNERAAQSATLARAIAAGSRKP